MAQLTSSLQILDSAPHEVPLLDRDGNSYAMGTLSVGGVSMEAFLLQVRTNGGVGAPGARRSPPAFPGRRSEERDL